jgi:hypothetical protein
MGRPVSNRKCGIEGCERQHYAHGYCNPHWRRWRISGDAGAVAIEPVRPLGPCSFEGCYRVRSCKGLCASHYAQMQRGKPLTSLEERGSGRAPAWQHQLRKRYGITPEQYQDQLERQGGGCAVCGEINVSGRRLHVDHDHSCCPTGRTCGRCLRGLLCSACNTGIGQFKDSPRLMLLAMDYLTRKRNG